MSAPALASMVGSLGVSLMVGAAVVVGVDPARRFPLAAVSPAVFAVVQLLFQGVRFDSEYPLSPLAWASYTFALQLVVVPLLVETYGPVQETLPWLPSDAAINGAFLVQSLAYVAFASGVALGGSRRSPAGQPIGNLNPISIAVL